LSPGTLVFFATILLFCSQNETFGDEINSSLKNPNYTRAIDRFSERNVIGVQTKKVNFLCKKY
jgi:hypothetical protein